MSWLSLAPLHCGSSFISKPRGLAWLVLTLSLIAFLLSALALSPHLLSVQRLRRSELSRKTPVRCASSDTWTLVPLAASSASIHPLLYTSLFSAYHKWHAKQRRCLSRAGLNSSSCAPVLVWTCPPRNCAGTGDRFRGIQFAYLLAVATRRVLLIDWSNPAALSAALRPATVDWTLPPQLSSRRRTVDKHIVLEIPRLPWWSCTWKRHCGTSLVTGNVSKFMANITDLPNKPVAAERNRTNPGDRPLNLLDDDVELALSKHHLLAVETRLHPRIQYLLANPHFRNSLLGNVSATDIEQIALATSPGAILRAISHVLFRPSEALQNSMRERQISLSSRYAAVHVRLGRDFGENGERFKAVNAELKKTAEVVLNCLQEVTDSPKTKTHPRSQHKSSGSRTVYLATDGHRFKSVFAEAARKRGIKVVSNPEHARHIQHMTPKRAGDQLCKAFEDIFADIWLLAQGETLIGTGSGFADMAARMGREKTYANVRFEEGGAKCVSGGGEKGRVGENETAEFDVAEMTRLGYRR